MIDPEIGVNVVDLGLVYGVVVEGNQVRVAGFPAGGGVGPVFLIRKLGVPGTSSWRWAPSRKAASRC